VGGREPNVPLSCKQEEEVSGIEDEFQKMG